MDFRRLDLLTSSLTAFRTFADLINAEGGYRPTIRISGPQATALADAYDLCQFARGDSRTAVRDVIKPIRKPAAPAPRKPRGPSKAEIARTIATIAADPRVDEVSWVEVWDEPAFDLNYRHPWISPVTGNCFDTQRTVAGALNALRFIYADPTADAEWDDVPEAQG